MKKIIHLHLLPYFGAKPLAAIDGGLAQDYRLERGRSRYRGRPPSGSSIHKEVVVLRQILRTAERLRWITSVPDLKSPFRESTKVGHRAWFSEDEYRQLYEATRKRAKNPSKPRYRWHYEQLHDLVLFLANTGLRTGEARNLEFRDVKIIKDKETRQTILEIDVRGKVGVGMCKSTASAVQPFERLQERLRRDAESGEHRAPFPTDRVFPALHEKRFRAILKAEKLTEDRNGLQRSLYSLRHTYICIRLLNNADIYNVAKNTRTSVEVIQDHYAVHLANSIDTAAVNARKPRRRAAKA